MTVVDGVISCEILPTEVEREALLRPITSQLTVTKAGYFRRPARCEIERYPGLSESLLIYCLSGQGTYRVAQTRGTIGPGDVAFFPVGVPHEYGSDRRTRWEIYWFHYAGALQSELHRLLGITAESSLVHIGRNEEAIRCFDSIIGELQDSFAAVNVTRASLTALHLFGLLQKGSLGAGGRVGRAHHLLASAKEFMRERVAGELTLAELAGNANLSPSRFSAEFRRLSGYSPIDYFIRLKLQHACRLLKTTDLSVGQVASSVGYDDQHYFSRLFSKVMGRAPSMYRQGRD